MWGGTKTGPGLRRWLAALGATALLAGGCAAWQSTPPPVLNQSDAARLSQRGQPTTLAQLDQGRALFVSRCAACHILPRPGAHSSEKWPTLVDEMAMRSKLAPAQAEAVLRYLLAARDVKVAQR